VLHIFKIGCIGFERVWMEKLQDNNPELKIFDTSKGVEFIKEKESAEESAHNNEVHSDSNHNEHSHHHEGIDPHIWNSTTNANIIADNIFNALCSLSQKDKEYFSIRRDSIKSVISKVDLKIRETLNNADSTFIIYHPALSYYAEEYGLRQICIEEGGKEPTPTYLKNLIDSSRKQKPHVIFIQKEFDIRNAELIADELNLKVVTINPLSYDWEKEMIEPAKALKKYE
jgi:ABC-type metal ion transport system, periplasmic component/surface adhesin